MIETNRLFKATAMPDSDWWHALWPDPRKLIRDLGIRAGMVAIDLGCGDGYFTAPLSDLLGGHLYALDLDPAMLESTRREIERIGATACHLFEADILDVERVVPEKADYVLIANTFHGVPDKADVARKVAIVLKPHGQFAIINWYPKPREETLVLGKPRGPATGLRMSPDDTRLAVESGGLRFSRLVELPPYHYASVFEKR
jgi:SAM-dependent methyltransferase